MKEIINLAIQGKGFFVVESVEKSERYYTRKGLFHLNEDGCLLTSCGKRLLEEGFKPLHWKNDEDVKKVLIAVLKDFERMNRIGDGMYRYDGEITYAIDKSNVHFIEEVSKIDFAKEFVEMLHLQKEISKKAKKIKRLK